MAAMCTVHGVEMQTVNCVWYQKSYVASSEIFTVFDTGCSHYAEAGPRKHTDPVQHVM